MHSALHSSSCYLWWNSYIVSQASASCLQVVPGTERAALSEAHVEGLRAPQWLLTPEVWAPADFDAITRETHGLQTGTALTNTVQLHARDERVPGNGQGSSPEKHVLQPSQNIIDRTLILVCPGPRAHAAAGDGNGVARCGLCAQRPGAGVTTV